MSLPDFLSPNSPWGFSFAHPWLLPFLLLVPLLMWLRGQRGVLRAEHDVINLELARREFAVSGERTRDVRGIAGILGADVQNDDVAIFHLSGKAIVMKRGGIWTRADNGSVAFGFGAAHLVHLHHFCSDLIFV